MVCIDKLLKMLLLKRIETKKKGEGVPRTFKILPGKFHSATRHGNDPL